MDTELKRAILLAQSRKHDRHGRWIVHPDSHRSAIVVLRSHDRHDDAQMIEQALDQSEDI